MSNDSWGQQQNPNQGQYPHGQYPQSQGQPDQYPTQPGQYGQAPQQYPPQQQFPARPQPVSRGRRIASTVLIVFGAFIALGTVSNLAQGNGPSGGSAEVFGYLIGVLLFIVVPLGLGFWLRRPKQ